MMFPAELLELRLRLSEFPLLEHTGRRQQQRTRSCAGLGIFACDFQIGLHGVRPRAGPTHLRHRHLRERFASLDLLLPLLGDDIAKDQAHTHDASSAPEGLFPIGFEPGPELVRERQLCDIRIHTGAAMFRPRPWNASVFRGH